MHIRSITKSAVATSVLVLLAVLFLSTSARAEGPFAALAFDDARAAAEKQGKVVFIDFTYIWVRWTLPRFRYDQVMQLGWKRMLPVSLVNIGIVALVGVFLGA